MSTFVTGFAPFRVPAYRRFIVGSSLGYVCLWMYLTVVAWTVLELTGSASVTGLVFVAMSLSVPFTTLAAGTLTDRLGPRTVVSVAFGVQGLATLATGYLALTGLINVPLVLLLALVLGAADGFVIVPAQVLAGRTVEPRVMALAVILGVLAFGIGRVVGAPIGGVVTASAGPGVALLLAGVGFVVAALVILTIPRIAGIGGGPRVSLADVRSGMTWVRRTRPAMVVVALGTVVALFVWPYLGLLPMIARDVLGAGSEALGLITAAGGIGAIVAALTAGVAARLLGPGIILAFVLLSGAVLVIAFGLAGWLPASMLISMLLSLSLLTFVVIGSLTLQAMAPLEIRGRVLAVNGFVTFGLMPLGVLLAALATDAWGVSSVLVMMGMIAVALSIAILLFAVRHHILDALSLSVAAVEPRAAVDPVAVPAEVTVLSDQNPEPDPRHL